MRRIAPGNAVPCTHLDGSEQENVPSISERCLRIANVPGRNARPAYHVKEIGSFHMEVKRSFFRARPNASCDLPQLSSDARRPKWCIRSRADVRAIRLAQVAEVALSHIDVAWWWARRTDLGNEAGRRRRLAELVPTRRIRRVRFRCS